MKKRIPFLVLALALVCSLLLFSANAADAPTTGICGDNATWTLDENGVLTIRGEGEMWNYTASSFGVNPLLTEAPWAEYSDSIHHVVIASGITFVGNHAFHGMTIDSVVLPEGLDAIGDFAFASALEKDGVFQINLPEGLKEIGRNAFAGSGIQSVTIPSSVDSIGDYAFSHIDTLEEITFADGFQTWENVQYGWAFSHDSSLHVIRFPATLTGLPEYAIDGCNNITDIYYDGTESDWNALAESFSDTTMYFFERIPATIHCRTETDGLITAQPQNYTGPVNSTASFSVSAEGEGLTYQWQISDDGVNWSNSSVKAAKYSTKLTSGKDGRMVRCIVSDQYGNSVTSDAATMKMAKLLITASPQDYMGKLNSTAKFTVSAQGDGLTYQWQTSSDGGKTWSNSSVKNASYSTKLTSGKDGRMVRCIVSDQYGNNVTSGTATMKVYQFAITTQPQNYVGKVNSSAKFTVIAVGDGLTYQWQYSDNGTKWSNSSVKSAVYTTKLTSARDGRYVRCIVTDCYGGKLTTNPVTMKIG